MVQIRQYHHEDKVAIIRLIKMLQEYVAELDPLRLNKAGDEFDAGKYTKKMLSTILDEKGIVFVAKEKTVIGFIAGIIHKTTAEEAIELHKIKEGHILELVVDPAYRGKQIGTLLIREIEKYFFEKKCEFIRVECFAPNKGAHDFYEKSGYSDRSVEMIKRP